ncbi:MAG: hypothetical protein ACK5LC_00855 [Coprobacillaceae bacterium]
MKKIKLIVVALLLSFSLVGCKQSEERNNAYDETYQLLYFYVETCAKCKEFEEEVLPLIEKEFGDNMEITMYNLDKVETKEPYDAVIDQLVDFNKEEDYGYGPFVVLDGYFAKLGLSSGDGEEFVDDLIRAVKGKSLGSELTNARYLFKDTKVKQ